MSEIQALTAVNSAGELESLEAVQAFRIRCVEDHNVNGARDAEAYCAAVARLRMQSEDMSHWAAKWMKEAVEFGVAIGLMLPTASRGDSGRGRPKLGPEHAGPIEMDSRRQSDYRALSIVPEHEREAYYAEVEAAGAAPSKSGLRRYHVKQSREAGIEAQKLAIAAGELTLPVGIFDVIDVDPPWPYAESIDRSGYDAAGHRASNPYPEMSLDAIRALPVPDHAADDCVLWLWTTHRFMRHAFPILDAWGFQERAIVTWAKDRMGLGRWLRSQSEFCIMATRGKPLIELTNQTTIVHGPMREHSRKPDEFYAMVESLCPAVRRLIWFGREPRAGWYVGGNEPEKFDAA